MSYFVLPSLSIFLNSETNVVKNLEPFNWANNSISLLLIADSVSSSCSSELKEFKISTFSTYISFKSTFSFCYFYIFLFKKCSRFFVSLYKEQLEPTFSVPVKVCVNLCEVLRFFVITYFISTVSIKFLAHKLIISDCFTDFLDFFLKNDSQYFLALRGSGTFSINFFSEKK